MERTAFSDIPPADQKAMLKQMGASERAARKHLAAIGCDTDLLLFHVWCATNSQLLEGMVSFKEQHARHRSTVARTNKLVRETEALRPKFRQATQDWNITADQMATLDGALGEFVRRLKLNCELNKNRQAQYMRFLEPAIQTIRSSYARHTGTVRDMGGCEEITWSGTVPPKYWEWLLVLLQACGRARGTLENLPHVTPGAIQKRVKRSPESAKKTLDKLFGSTARTKTNSR